MFGLMAMIGLGLILLIYLGIITWAIGYARTNGKSSIRWGWAAALILPIFIFWNWIPSAFTHMHYCSSEAGLWVYKNVDQWKAENPEVFDTLHAYNPPIQLESHDDNGNNWSYAEQLNQRISYTQITEDYGPFWGYLRRSSAVLTDNKNDIVLSKYVDFSTSGRNRRADWGWRTWLEREHCSDNGVNRAFKFHELLDQFKR